MIDRPPAIWHETGRPYSREAVATDLIAAAVRRAPDATALVGPDGQTLTYGQAWAAACQIARLLAGHGCGPGDYVGVVGRHTSQTVLGIVGTALAGAAFVPVDPSWPTRRQAEVVAAVGARWLLAAAADVRGLAALAEQVPSALDVLLLDVPDERALDQFRRDETTTIWDAIARSPDPVQAAGFDLQGSHRYTAAEAAAYAGHVARIVLAEEPASVLEVGFGSGLVLRKVAPQVDFFAGVEPAPSAVAAGLAFAEERGLMVDLVVGFADDVAGLGMGPVDVAVLASTVQYFPDHDYLHAVLGQLAQAVRPGGRVVLADLLPPDDTSAPGGLLRVSRDWLRGLVSADGLAAVEFLGRDAVPGLPGELAGRYDAVLRRSEASSGQLSSGQPSSDEASGHAAPGADGQPRPRLRTWRQVSAQPATALQPRAGPDDIAYVIFTSGSTGKPKGVVVAHRSLVNTVEWANREFAVGPGDMLLHVSSFAFDLSVYDVFGVLAAGATLRLAGDAVSEPARLADVLRTEPVTFWHSAPALLAWVLPFVPPPDGAGQERRELRRVFLAGDWIPLSMPDEIRARFPDASQIVSFGGATETTVWSIAYRIGAVDPSWPSIPYGRPMQNARYYVLDEHLQETRIGEPGELYIAGECLALGYHDDPRLTASRFVPDTVHGGHGDRMYATGDLARWQPDGEMQFLGRRDLQVKINGYRVELGEVEAAMAAHPGVRAAVVVPVEIAGGRALAGFYTSHLAEPAAAELRAALADRLPQYLMPAALHPLPELPLTTNGKVDRAALAKLASARVAQ